MADGKLPEAREEGFQIGDFGLQEFQKLTPCCRAGSGAKR
jgi:hypothetical protein